MIDKGLLKALFRMEVHPRAVTSMQVASYLRIPNQEAKVRLKALNRSLFGDTKIANEEQCHDG